MDRTKLKYLAALLMLIDHLPLPAGPITLLLHALGRPAFPIFAWMVAEGMQKTHDQKAYLLRMGLFAAISELPFYLLFGHHFSVLTTFLLALLALALYERLRESLPLATALLPVLASMTAAELLHTDYAFPGVLLVAALFLLGDNQKAKLRFLGGWAVFCYLFYLPFPHLQAMLPAGLLTPNLGHVLTLFIRETLPSNLLLTLFALLSVPLLWRYNGQAGRDHKWFFYWFYPIHLLLLSLPRLLALLP